MTKTAKAYIAAIILTGTAIALFGLSSWHSDDAVRFPVFLVLISIAATLKARIPQIAGTYSPVFFFCLLGSATLSFPEATIASAVAGIVQCIFKAERRPSSVQIAFNAASLVLSTAGAFVCVQRLAPGLQEQPQLLGFFLGACVFYVVNTGLVSIVITLVSQEPVSQIWRHWCFGSLLYYLVGALMVAVTMGADTPATFLMVILVAPPLLLATIYYRLWAVRTVPESIALVHRGA